MKNGVRTLFMQKQEMHQRDQIDEERTPPYT